MDELYKRTGLKELKLHANRVGVRNFYARIILVFCILGTLYFSTLTVFCMQNVNVTMSGLLARLDKIAGVYIAVEDDKFNTYITKMSLTEELLAVWATTISGAGKGELHESAKMSLINAFKHPVVVILDKLGDKVLFTTLTHSTAIKSIDFSGFTRYLNELDATMQYKPQYMSEVFLSVDLNLFIQALNDQALILSDSENLQKCTEWLKSSELKSRFYALSEFSLVTDAFLEKMLLTAENKKPEIWMTRYDGSSGDILTLKYKYARILNEMPFTEWQKYLGAFKKLK